MSEISNPVIYQLKVVLLGISPMIWRRIKVRSDNTIADLHYIIQIVMGWKDEHLHKFSIYGVNYGISYVGGIGFFDNAHEVKLSRFNLRERELFTYEYDFCSNWKHSIRVEAILQDSNKKPLPLCSAGKGACPPEHCGGVRKFIQLRQQHNQFSLAIRVGEIILNEGIDEVSKHRDELVSLHYWSTINDKIDCSKINHRLQQYIAGDEAWRDYLVETIG